MHMVLRFCQLYSLSYTNGPTENDKSDTRGLLPYLFSSQTNYTLTNFSEQVADLSMT